MNGNIAILKSVLAEITDESNQARAFSLIPLCFAVGSIIGNGLGGWLVGVGEGKWWKEHEFWCLWSGELFQPRSDTCLARSSSKRLYRAK